VSSKVLLHPGKELTSFRLDPAECEDLRLLCRLMQGLKGVPYTRDGDHPVSHSQLVRLVILASKLQVKTCVSECAVELGRVMSVDVAKEVLDHVPSEMDGWPEVRRLRQQARGVLIRAVQGKIRGQDMRRVFALVGGLLEEKAFEIRELDELQRAVAFYLGPVHELWSSGPTEGGGWKDHLSDMAKVRPRTAKGGHE
jgi:hypothetical protein